MLSIAVGIRISRPTAALACTRALGLRYFDKRISKLTSRRHQHAHPDPGILADVRKAIASIGPEDLLTRAAAFRTRGSGAEAKKEDEVSNTSILDNLIGEWTSMENTSIKVIYLPTGPYVSFDPGLVTFTKLAVCGDSVAANGYQLAESRADTLLWRWEKSEFSEEKEVIWQRQPLHAGGQST